MSSRTRIQPTISTEEKKMRKAPYSGPGSSRPRPTFMARPPIPLSTKPTPTYPVSLKNDMVVRNALPPVAPARLAHCPAVGGGIGTST